MASIIATTNNDDERKEDNNMNNNNVEVICVVTEKTAGVNTGNLSFIDVLPSGGAGKDIIYTILTMLDMKSFSSVIYSSFIQLFCKNRNDDTLYQMCKIIQYPYLNKKYIKEFIRGTPLVCACEKGRLNDVKLLITCRNDVNGSDGNMTLKEYVNQVGKDSWGREYTPLMAAAYEEHFQVVKYLIEQGEADPNIATSNGWNALHYAARNNRTTTELIELLLTHMTLNSINKKNRWGFTPLDSAYHNNRSPIKQEIIALLRLKGGKANCHDENGRFVGDGNGDLNH